MSDKPKAQQSKSFSLSTILLSQRIILTWGKARREKFFKDLGLGTVWRNRKKKAFSGPYLVSDVFDYIRTRRAGMLSDVIREIVRVEWYLLEFERRRRSLMNVPLANLFTQRHEPLINSLKSDGYTLREGEIVPFSIEELKEIRDTLELKLRTVGFNVALTHYDQAWENYILSNWEAANSQLRTFVEAVFDEIASRLYPQEARSITESGGRRKLLETKSFLDEKASLVKSFFQMAHTRGAHAGLSDEPECRFRHGQATLLADYYLDKYQRI